MSNPTLTGKQEQVYKYLVKTMSGSIPPSVREICHATGIKSTSTVHAVLKSLEDGGYILRDPKFSRSIRISGACESSQIPVLGRVTAGQPILAVEEIEDYIPYPISATGAESLFALRVVGLSMRDAGILDGDIIIADKDAAWHSGDIVVALIEDEATVKRIILKDNSVILMPENPDYSPIYPENPSVLGKVVGSFRKY